MRSFGGWLLIGLALVCARPGHCQADKSIIDLHGQDAIAFSLDDPLRVSAAVHNGVFFVTHSAVSNVDAVADSTGQYDAPQLGFVNLAARTVTRCDLDLAAGTAKPWETPLPLAEDRPVPQWDANADHYVAGNGLQHDIQGIAGDKDHPALFLDPKWLKQNDGSVQDTLLDLVEEIRVERLIIQKCNIVGVMRLENSHEELTGSLRVKFSTMWAHVQILFLDFWKSMDGAAAAPGAPASSGTLSNLSNEQKAKIDQQLAGSGLTGKVTSDQIVEAAKKTNPTCAQVAAGLTPDECNAALTLVTQVNESTSSIDSLDGSGGMVQAMMDSKMHYEEGPPRKYGWGKWRDPLDPNAPGSKVITSVMQVKMQTEVKKLLNSPQPQAQAPGALPIGSGADMFNSLYLYSPREIWLLDKNGKPGLVENFAVAHLNLLNPYKPSAAAAGKASWEMLDLVRAKALTANPPDVKWPPVPAESFAGGTCQILGDEAATGISTLYNGGAVPPPEKYSHIIVAVSPDKKNNNLRASFLLRKLSSLNPPAAQATAWTELTDTPMPLPPNYDTPGNTLGVFRVGLSNLRYAAPQGLEFGWDFDGDGNFDGVYGNTVRELHPTLQAKMSTTEGAFATCYVHDPATGATGVGIANIKR